MPPVAQIDEVSTASFSVISAPKRSLASHKPTKVSFKEDAFEFHEVDCFCDDEDLAEAIWYTKSEYDIIKARNSLIAKMQKAGKFRESSEHTFRGLEHKLKAAFKFRREIKFDALNAVLEEQDRQYSRNQPDATRMAEIYIKVSAKSQEIAATIGARDAAIAQGRTLDDALGKLSSRELSEPVHGIDEASKADGADDDMTIHSEASQSKKKGLRRIFSPRKSSNRRRASL